MDKLELSNISNFDIDEFILTTTENSSKYETKYKLIKLNITDLPYKNKNKLTSRFTIEMDIWCDIQRIYKSKKHKFTLIFTYAFNQFIENMIPYRNLTNVKYQMINMISHAFKTEKSEDNYKIEKIKINDDGTGIDVSVAILQKILVPFYNLKLHFLIQMSVELTANDKSLPL